MSTWDTSGGWLAEHRYYQPAGADAGNLRFPVALQDTFYVHDAEARRESSPLSRGGPVSTTDPVVFGSRNAYSV